MKLTEIERAEITTALATLCEAQTRLMEVEDSLPELEEMGFGEEEETIQQKVLKSGRSWVCKLANLLALS